MTRAKLDIVAIKDEAGQLVRPGDKVAFVTMSTGTMGTGIGTYQGTVNGGARILEDFTVNTYHHPETDEDLTDWQVRQTWVESLLGKRPENWGYYKPYPHKNPNYETEQQTAREYADKLTALLETRVVKKHSRQRIRSLQNNVIFKIGK